MASLLKMENLTPFDVPINSHKKLWWKCNEADDHEWQATVILDQEEVVVHAVQEEKLYHLIA